MFKRFFRSGKTVPGASPDKQEGLSRSNDAAGGGTGASLGSELGTAIRHHQAGRITQAEAAYRGILAADPGNSDAMHLLGVVAYQLGRLDEASERISKALSQDPANAPAHNNLGNVLRAQGRLDEADACFRRAVTLQPNYVDAHISLGALMRARGDPHGALACYQNARALAPRSPAVILSLGNLFDDLDKPEEAIECYRQALLIKPDFFEGQLNLGNVLAKRGRLRQAVDCYRKAIAIKPDSHAAHVNLGNALNEQGEPAEAAACYVKAIALKSDFAEAHYGLGNALKSQDKLDQAIASYRNALALEPAFPEAHFWLGNALRDQDLTAEVQACYRMALSLRPDYVEARWAMAMSQLPAVYAIDDDPARCRAAFSAELDELDRWFDTRRTADGYRAVGIQQPFCLAYQEEDNRDLLARYGRLCNRLMTAWFERQAVSGQGQRSHGGPIRVGVVSRYFRNHSVWNAIVKGWFQQLDRSRFSLHVFHLGAERDQETAFAQANAAYFEQGPKGLREWVEAVVGQTPDVLIYPEIGMDAMTLKLASLRLAPIQIATWGHPETTGLPTVDYYLSAEDLEPDAAHNHYTERLVTLPHLGCYYDAVQVASAPVDLHALRLESGIPLIICPGVPFKYAPQHDGIIVEIARRLGSCQFVFFTHRLDKLSEKLRHRLQTVFARSQLDFSRFVRFVPWQSSPAFAGLLKRADVYIDTVGFSGFNTAVQALECGLPVVTREGRFMRGRLASGLLKRMGLPELVAASDEHYVALAVRLAQDAAFRQSMRDRIEVSRRVLFEDVAPIRALEDFLAGVVGR